MANLHVVTWLWGESYGEHYVRKLASAVHRNLTEAHRFICFTDRTRHLDGINQYLIPNIELTRVKGCFARLRLFDPHLQERACIKPGDRIVNLDLDLVVTGGLDALFDRKDDFTILQHVNSTNPNPKNGSLWMFRAGTRPDIWTDFSLENYAKFGGKIHAIPDDQGWFDAKIPDAGAYTDKDGCYAFKKRSWPSGDALPANARIVAFPGWRDPAKFEHLPWIKENWRL